MFTFHYVGGESGHYEVYRGTTLLFSADTLREAYHEIDALPR